MSWRSAAWMFAASLFAGSVLAGAGPALARQTAESIDELARLQWARSTAPGMAYALVDHDQIRTGAHGVVEAGSDEPVTADTPFPLASISKSFTALAILQRVEAGQLELDAAVSRYLPVFADGPGASVTLRQLLSHTSGYSTIQGNENQARDGEREDHLRHHVERIASWTPAHLPGLHFEYSNANYLILGAVIEAVTGRSYGEYVETEILAPLGMRHASVADGSPRPAMTAAHPPWFGGRRTLSERGTDRLTAPAGGVIASARDVALYLSMMMNGQDDLISAEHKALMMSPAGAASSFYGLGWQVDSANGIVSHDGLVPGVQTLAMMRPQDGKAVVVLVNANGGLGFGETAALRYAVALEALGMDFQPAAGQWGRKSLSLIFWLLPLVFAAGMATAWIKRAGLRAKTGLIGAFRLWFPLLMSLALAWICLALLPSLFGVSLSTLAQYQPDWTIGLWASALTGLAWAIFRLGLYYRSPASEPLG